MAEIDFSILKPREEIEDLQITSNNQGTFKEITFQQAISISGKTLFSDRSGNYVLSSFSPSILWSAIVSPPYGLKFLFNRKLKQLRGIRYGKLLFNHRVNY